MHTGFTARAGLVAEKGTRMPIEYAILLVAGIYLVGGLAYVEWIHPPCVATGRTKIPPPRIKTALRAP